MPHSWLSPERFDSKRTRLPSGDQRGCLSFFVVLVSWRGGPLPSAATSQRADAVEFAARSTAVRTYTTVLPSGLIWGSLTRRKRNRSSTVIGRRLPSAACTVATSNNAARSKTHFMDRPFAETDTPGRDTCRGDPAHCTLTAARD